MESMELLANWNLDNSIIELDGLPWRINNGEQIVNIGYFDFLRIPGSTASILLLVVLKSASASLLILYGS